MRHGLAVRPPRLRRSQRLGQIRHIVALHHRAAIRSLDQFRHAAAAVRNDHRAAVMQRLIHHQPPGLAVAGQHHGGRGQIIGIKLILGLAAGKFHRIIAPQPRGQRLQLRALRPAAPHPQPGPGHRLG